MNGLVSILNDGSYVCFSNKLRKEIESDLFSSKNPNGFYFIKNNKKMASKKGYKNAYIYKH